MGHKGTRFANMEDIKSNATAELRKIPNEIFRRCFQQWQDRWSKWVCAQGSYFEGNWVSVVICPTITVLYHIYGNFLTALRISRDMRMYSFRTDFRRVFNRVIIPKPVTCVRHDVQSSVNHRRLVASDEDLSEQRGELTFWPGMTEWERPSS